VVVRLYLIPELGSQQLSRLPSNAKAGEIRCGVSGWSEMAVRGEVESLTFRFSGLRMTVQDRPRRSLWLLSGPEVPDLAQLVRS
jgi:hypothetical protein